MGRILALLAGACVIGALVWHPASSGTPAVLAASAPPPRSKHLRVAATPGSGDPVVYVAGAVARPGLYRLSRGARADDAVRRAGGLRSDADSANINLAAHVSDGDEVFAPVLGQPTPRPLRRHAVRRTKAKAPAASLDVNTASAVELATVPGIGETLAARIVDVRDRDGTYATFDELLDVAGMTPARLQRAEPYLAL